MSHWETQELRPDFGVLRLSRFQSICRSVLLWALGRSKQGSFTFIEGDSEIRVGEPDATGLRAKVQVFDGRFYVLAILKHSLGAAEAYKRGYWEAEELTDVIRIFVRRRGHESNWEKLMAKISVVPAYFAHLLRNNNRTNSRKNIEAHYDLGNDFFELFLDESLTYSSGIFASEESTMLEASELKLKRMCEKLGLHPGLSVVEIGSGWGSFAIYAARNYGCRVKTVTLSKQQFDEAKRRICEANLDHLVDIQLMDYRELEGKFDRLVSIEMIEAIGHSRMPEYFAQCARLLNSDGLMAIQAITMPDQGYREYLRRTDFIQQYVFPGSCCPARSAILAAATKSSDLRVVDLEEIGMHYATTLARWREKFVAAIPQIMELGYPAEFIRVWHYYLCYCEGGFAERYVGDVQLVFSKLEYRGEVYRDGAEQVGVGEVVGSGLE
ncbi:MAG: class I SAM-dependent methyltransferase [Fimbriimonadaceae bacterium]